MKTNQKIKKPREVLSTLRWGSSRRSFFMNVNTIMHMNKKITTAREIRSSCGWEDLHKDILLMIFKRLDHKNLFKTAYFVCRYWQLVCNEILFWREDGTINLVVLEGMFFFTTKFLPPTSETRGVHGGGRPDVNNNNFAELLETILCGMGDKCEVATRLLFPAHLSLSDDHLLYIAQRLPKLHEICFPCTTSLITGIGFSRAIPLWSELRALHIGPIYFSDFSHMIQEIGINCKNLERLCIYTMDVRRLVLDDECNTFSLNEDTCSVIANNLSTIKTSVLDRCLVYESGLKYILSKCKGLRIILSWCVRARRNGKHLSTATGFISLSIKQELKPPGNTIQWSLLKENEKEELFNSLVSLFEHLWYNENEMGWVNLFSDEGREIARSERKMLTELRANYHCCH